MLATDRMPGSSRPPGSTDSAARAAKAFAVALSGEKGQRPGHGYEAEEGEQRQHAGRLEQQPQGSAAVVLASLGAPGARSGTSASSGTTAMSWSSNTANAARP